jgi:hypothetical protein
MTPPQPIRFLALLVAAIGSPLFGLVVPVAVASAASTTGCTRPTLVAFVDPTRGSPMDPHIDAHWADLVTPAQARIDWGNGEYGVAAVDVLQSGSQPVAVDPRYVDPGAYTLRFTITDACGETWVDTMSVSVPLSTATAPGIACPGTADPSGFCLVPLGDGAMLQVADIQAPAAGWTWRTDRPLAGASPDIASASVDTTLTDAVAHTVQASAVTPGGWVVTRPLTLVGVARRPNPIDRFAAPHTAVTGEPVALDFDLPAAPIAGIPHIAVDGGAPLDGTAASVALTEGSHTISYSVTYPDGSSVQRQTIVIAQAAPMPASALIVAVAASILGLGFLGFLGRVRGRRAKGKESRTRPVATPIDGGLPAASSAFPSTVAAWIPPVGLGAAHHVPRSNSRPPGAKARPRLHVTGTLGVVTAALVIGVLLIDRRSHS